MIQDVEELGPELQRNALGNMKALINGAIEVPEGGRGGPEYLTLAEWQLIDPVAGEHVRAIEIRSRALEPPVAGIDWRPRIRRAQSAAGGRADRIHRLIVNRFRERVREAEHQP